jgi:dihydropteroate synthase
MKRPRRCVRQARTPALNLPRGGPTNMHHSPNFDWGSRTYVMGIVNATPDSFSGDGLAGDLDAALRLAERMLAEGADLLDVGGESTRPGAESVDERRELDRVVPLIEALAQRFDAPLSVDTSRAEVARQALAAGASMVNDVRALGGDPALANVVAASGAWVVLRHNRRAEPTVDQLGGHYPEVQYDDVLRDTRSGLADAARSAEQAGIAAERIIVDPGLGFGKTYSQNLELIRRLPELRWLGRPLLVGASRKSFTGRGQGLTVDQRLETSLAILSLCVAGGADLVRVHDVGASVRAARMVDAIVRPLGAR